MSVNLLLDTNCFRYYAHSKDRSKILPFWQMIRYHGANYNIFTSDEVGNEIEVQKYSISEQEYRIIKDELFPLANVVPYQGDREREYALIELNSYIRNVIGLPIPPNELLTKPLSEYKKIEGIEVADARILLTALDNDCVIVTRNIKDFMCMVCIRPDLGLWDPMLQAMVVIPQEYREAIDNDPFIQEKIKLIESYTEKI